MNLAIPLSTIIIWAIAIVCGFFGIKKLIEGETAKKLEEISDSLLETNKSLEKLSKYIHQRFHDLDNKVIEKRCEGLANDFKELDGK